MILQVPRILIILISYSIMATPKGLYEGSDGKSVEVWSRAYPLFNSETISGTGKKFSISQPIT